MIDSKHREQAQDAAKYDAMVKLLVNATSKEELERMALLYIVDRSYPRADICLAIKAVELANGWH
jgi:hypothetical protein